jgi:hypothetical protein
MIISNCFRVYLRKFEENMKGRKIKQGKEHLNCALN